MDTYSDSCCVVGVAAANRCRVHSVMMTTLMVTVESGSRIVSVVPVTVAILSIAMTPHWSKHVHGENASAQKRIILSDLNLTTDHNMRLVGRTRLIEVRPT